eukprot:363560-Chlamydomonas_euryale.AAC.14
MPLPATSSTQSPINLRRGRRSRSIIKCSGLQQYPRNASTVAARIHGDRQHGVGHCTAAERAPRRMGIPCHGLTGRQMYTTLPTFEMFSTRMKP